MKSKRFFSAVVASALILNTIAVTAGAEEPQLTEAGDTLRAGITQNGITYEVLEDGTLGVKKADEIITKAVIPETVNGEIVDAIVSMAFKDCDSLTFVTIPNSVKTIGEWAFGGCSGLTSVSIPNSVVSIDQEAFLYCTGLTFVTIPDSVTYIGKNVFDHCHDLKDVYYTGTEQQWEKLLTDNEWDGRIAYGDYFNPAYFTPTVHFNSDGPSAEAKPADPRYDINGDNSVTISDVITLLRKVTGGETDSAYDVNGDGVVNINDVLQLLRIVVKG